MLTTILGACAVFLLRILDVSIGTIRLLYTVRGQRYIASSLAFVEGMIWVAAVAIVFSALDNPINMVAFAGGFATGTFCGMTLERWIGAGHVLIRVMTSTPRKELLGELREHGFGLTAIHGEGMNGSVKVLLLVARRRRSKKAMELIKAMDPDAFVSIDPVSPVTGGYYVPRATPSLLRK